MHIEAASQAAGDRIAIRGIRGYGHHGVLAAERRDGQEFAVDVELGLDVREAARTDDLSLTVNYAEIALAVHRLVEGEPVDLIETLADRIATACLSEARVTDVVVTVHKPSAPIPVPFDDVTVTVRRARD